MKPFVRAVLTLVLLTVVAAHGAAQGSIPTPQSRCVQNCGAGGGTSPATAPSAPERRTGSGDRADFLLTQGIDFYNRGQWTNAVRTLEDALDQDPGNEEILHWIRRAKAAPSSGPRAARLKQLIDPRAVDARNVPSGLTKALEDAIAGAYKSAPPGVSDRVRKGFQAVMARDWKVADGWFRDALLRDAANPGLRRLVAAVGGPPQASTGSAAVPQALAGNTARMNAFLDELAVELERELVDEFLKSY